MFRTKDQKAIPAEPPVLLVDETPVNLDFNCDGSYSWPTLIQTNMGWVVNKKSGVYLFSFDGMSAQLLHGYPAGGSLLSVGTIYVAMIHQNTLAIVVDKSCVKIWTDDSLKISSEPNVPIKSNKSYESRSEYRFLENMFTLGGQTFLMGIGKNKEWNALSGKVLWFLDIEEKDNNNAWKEVTSKAFFKGSKKYHTIDAAVAIPNVEAKNFFAILSSGSDIYFCELAKKEIQKTLVVTLPGLSLDLWGSGCYLSSTLVNITTIVDLTDKQNTHANIGFNRAPYYGAQKWVKNLCIVGGNKNCFSLLSPSNLAEYEFKVGRRHTNVRNLLDDGRFFVGSSDDKTKFTAVQLSPVEEIKTTLENHLPGFSSPLRHLVLSYMGVFAKPNLPIPLSLPDNLRRELNNFLNTNKQLASEVVVPGQDNSRMIYAGLRVSFIQQLMVFIDNLTLEHLAKEKNPIQAWIDRFFTPVMRVSRNADQIKKDTQIQDNLLSIKNDAELKKIISQLTSSHILNYLREQIKIKNTKSLTV